VIETLSDDARIRKWASDQLDRLDKYAERETLYRETVKVASQLVPNARSSQTDAARTRFEQLYFADLPYVNEDECVQKAMADFRNNLVTRDADPKKELRQLLLETSLIALSKQLRESSTKSCVASQGAGS
jgi:hypothetical protein